MSIAIRDNFYLKARIIEGNTNDNIIFETNEITQEYYNKLFNLGKELYNLNNSHELECSKYEIAIFSKNNSLINYYRPDKSNFDEFLYKDNFNNYLEQSITNYLQNEMIENKNKEYQAMTWDRRKIEDTTRTYNVDLVYQNIDKIKTDSNYVLYSKEEVLNYIINIFDLTDFDLAYDMVEDSYSLIDKQEANLGNIEQEQFNNLVDVINRLETYIDDTFYRCIEDALEEIGGDFDIPSDYKEIAKVSLEMLEKGKLDKYYLNDIETLYFISDIETYEDLLTDRDLINENLYPKLLKEGIEIDESFYKTICDKYFNTMYKEHIIKDKENKLLHLIIEDGYGDKKEEINIENYHQFLDDNSNISSYDSYQSLVENYVKDNVRYDMKDLGIYNLKNEWDFYLSKNELLSLGIEVYEPDHDMDIEREF